MSPINGHIEVRLNDDGTIDEVVLRDAFGRCWAHLEQMDKAHWFLGLYPDGEAGERTTVLDIRRDHKRVVVEEQTR